MAFLPVQAALGDGAAQGFALHMDAGFRDVDEFRRGDVRHAKAALILGHDKAAGGQARQGLPQRNRSAAVALAQILDTQTGPWGQVSRDDVCANVVRQGGRRCTEGLRGGVHA
jgi:hypothetical protein